MKPVAWMQSNHLSSIENLHPGSSMMLARCSHFKAMDDFKPLYTEAQLKQARADALREAAEYADSKGGCGLLPFELRRMADEMGGK